MVTNPAIVRIENGSYVTPVVFELDPRYIATDAITVKLSIGRVDAHVTLYDLEQAVNKLVKLAEPTP